MNSTESRIKSLNDASTVIEEVLQFVSNIPFSEEIKADSLKMLKDINRMKQIDQKLVTHLQLLSESDKLQVFPAGQYDVLYSNANPDNIVLYFKRAGLMKTYDKNSLNLLYNQLNTDFRRDPEIYEVVNENQPQKITVIMDASIKDHIDDVKQYIRSFFAERKVKIDLKDLVSFENSVSNTWEILINGYFVQNYAERERIVNDLVKYIENKERNNGNTFDVTGIEPRTMKEFSTANLSMVPNKKGQLFVNDTKNFLSVVSGCKTYMIKNCTFNINAVNTVSGNVSINSGNTHTTNINVESSDPIIKFIHYILDNEPPWYKEGKGMATDELYSHFVDITKSDMKKNTFSGQIRYRLYDKDSSAINTPDGRKKYVVVRSFEDITVHKQEMQ